MAICIRTNKYQLTLSPYVLASWGKLLVLKGIGFMLGKNTIKRKIQCLRAQSCVKRLL